MSKKHDHESPYVALNEEERADPFGVLEDYCINNTLFNARVDFFAVFSAAMGSGSFKDDTPLDKSRRMWFFQQGIQLIEAIYRIEELHKTGQMVYRINLNE
jgi:hypothetical protein